MAKQPGTPKPKSGAPAQFDMNSRERRGGKGGPGGAGRRGRDDKRPPSRIESLPPSLVDRGEGWAIWKIGKVDQASHAPVGAEYHLVFEGHDPLIFSSLGAARERSKAAPPEKVQAEEAETAASEDGATAAPTSAEAPELEAPELAEQEHRSEPVVGDGA